MTVRQLVRRSRRQALRLWAAWHRFLRARRAPVGRTGVGLVDDGPQWLTELLMPTLAPARDGDRSSIRSSEILRIGRSAPFIQPRLANPIRRVVPTQAPDGFRELAADASFATSDRRRRDEWWASTATAHGAYRAAHSRTVDDVVDDELRRRGLGDSLDFHDPPRFAPITVVSVTNRPEQLAHVFANVERQLHPNVELVIVTNSHAFDRDDLDAAVSKRRNASVIHRNEGDSLGTCLNAGMRTSDRRFVAKFDDDDWYGPNYLTDALIAHNYADAAVVGKHTYYAHLEATDELVLRFPGHEFRHTSYLAGGTLVVDRDQTTDLAFDDVSLGEDQAFIAACHRRGLSVFAADRFNFLQHRGTANTWQIDHEQFLVSSVLVDADDPAHLIER